MCCEYIITLCNGLIRICNNTFRNSVALMLPAMVRDKGWRRKDQELSQAAKGSQEERLTRGSSEHIRPSGEETPLSRMRKNKWRVYDYDECYS